MGDLTKNVLNPVGMVDVPRKTAALGMPAPKTEKIASLDLTTKPVDKEARDKQVRDLSK